MTLLNIQTRICNDQVKELGYCPLTRKTINLHTCVNNDWWMLDSYIDDA